MTIKFECSYDVDINMYILLAQIGYVFAQVADQACRLHLQVAYVLPEMSIRLCSGKFQVLDWSYF